VTWRLGGPDHGRGGAAGIGKKMVGMGGSQGKRTVRGDGGRREERKAGIWEWG
jgi:hypothetical protein